MWRLRPVYRATYSTLRGDHEPAPSVPRMLTWLLTLTGTLGVAGLAGGAAWASLEVIRKKKAAATTPVPSPPAEPTRWEKDITRLNLPDSVQAVLRVSVHWLEKGQPLGALAGVKSIVEGGAAEGTEFRSFLGELLCDSWIQTPRMLHNLVFLASQSVEDFAVQPTAAALVELTHGLLLPMMLDKTVRGVPAVPSLQWLAVAALCTPSLTKALTEKLAADLLETDLHRQRADIVPILILLGSTDLRILQLGVLRDCLANFPAQSPTGGGDFRTRMATYSLKLADKCIDDLRDKRESPIGPQVIQRLVVLHLHNTAQRLLPPEAEARKLGTPSETREAFAELCIQRAFISQIFRDGNVRRHLLDALTWLDPSSHRYALVEKQCDKILLRAIQFHRETHGEEIV